MPIKRDFAFLVSIDILSEDLINSIKKSLNSITYIKLIEINLFDIYLDNLSSSELKSLAFEVIMQPTEKTLKENEISDITNLIIMDVKKNTNAVLRS
jgi:phenylalanyl-tRNA synthetase beta chain